MSLASSLTRLAAIAFAFGIAAAPTAAQTPIPGAGGWLLVDTLPGSAPHACTARVAGPEADVMLLLNAEQVPVLIAGRPDWHDLGGSAEIVLSIDGEPPTRLNAHMVANLVLVLLSDAPLLRRLRSARTLDWTLPFGRFRANVSGLGTALDAISACAAASGTPSAQGA
jgi:hypothetical protein